MGPFLLRLSLILTVAGTALAAFMPLLGAALPARAFEVEVGFAACELPCWGAITPGETSFDEAAPVLQSVLPGGNASRFSISPSQINFSTRGRQQDMSGFLYTGDGRVGYLRLYVALPAAYLLAHLGTPGCVWLDQAFPGQEVLILYWVRGSTLVGAMFIPDATGRWRPDARTANIWMTTNTPSCPDTRAVDWQGFAPLARYRAVRDAQRG